MATPAIPVRWDDEYLNIVSNKCIGKKLPTIVEMLLQVWDSVEAICGHVCTLMNFVIGHEMELGISHEPIDRLSIIHYLFNI